MVVRQNCDDQFFHFSWTSFIRSTGHGYIDFPHVRDGPHASNSLPDYLRDTPLSFSVFRFKVSPV